VNEQKKRLIIGISGASGVIYGIRLLEILRMVESIETHLVMSAAAKRTAILETDYSIEQIEALADQTYRTSDIAASLSSGSFQTLGMVVVPCSIKTLSGVVHCYSDNLLLRAADVVLKDRRTLDLFGIQLEQDLFQRWQMKSGEHKGETTLAYRDAKALLTREQSSF
jgi:4-hydroxy-3-polyprenylbenzoate decarboxylase